MKLMRGASSVLLVWLWAAMVLGAGIDGQDREREQRERPEVEKQAIERQDLEAFVDGFVTARMEAHHVAGVTVAVVKNDALVLARGFGSADIEAGRPVVAERTLFRPGSISKLFTWTAVMQLVEQGRLDLDTDVREYLPGFPLETRYSAPITLRQLMAHTPGFEDTAMGHLFEDDPDAVLSLPEYLRRHAPAQVRPPGTWPAYSNFGVALAGRVVEVVSGLSWEAYAERHLLAPLGMRDSTFREPWGPQREQTPMAPALRERVSEGYQWVDGAFRPGGFTFVGGIGPAGSLSTTATDMARFMRAHLNEGRLGEVALLAPETAREMQRTHYRVAPGQPGMAHGFIESEIAGYRALGHGGGTVHFVSDLQLIPELELGVFISTNSNGGQALIRGFAEELVRRYFPAEPPSTASAPDDPQRYAGDYLSTRRPYTTVEALLNHDMASVHLDRDGQLVLSRRGREIRLMPAQGEGEGEGLFRQADSGEPLRFLDDQSGTVTHLAVPEPIMVMERVGPLANPRWRLAFLGLAGLVFVATLGSALLGGWRRPRARRATVRWAARLTLLAAGLWVVSMVLALAGVLPITRDVGLVFFGFPPPAFVAAQVIAMLAGALSLGSLALLAPVLGETGWTPGRRLRHAGLVVLLTLTLVTVWQFNGFVLMG
ncbi:serine hydrolase domain-containing protein [Halomonas saccharevitans]|uniref:CubicO group peptidase, beta-lactamase class C family n=1 Tax=Halomonas saccharevitans TaxID=416872 RepID=A0A1I7A3Y7_9GAMM|nr:serine hydrolase domain-containing protein [Halomonas saccharevitans]SFT69617.1 CubicO group peptidase, beta-lactamase class C family [Halomonas saccharevitans]